MHTAASTSATFVVPPTTETPRLPCQNHDDVSRILRRVSVRVKNSGMTLGELLELLGDRGLLLMCVILASPFLMPFSLPGSSTPGGVVMLLVGLSLWRGRPVWLPSRLLRLRLHGRTWGRILLMNARLLRRSQAARWMVPPLRQPTTPAHGLLLMVAAAIFVLPIPVPLANMFPGYAVVCLALGLLQRNVMLVGAAYTLTLVSMAYLGLTWQAGVAGVEALATAF